jgi:hypothetical protein
MARHFTVQEANELLATVRPLVERLVEQRREVVRQLERKEELGGLTQTNGGGFPPRLPADIDTALDEAAGELKRTIEELTDLGVQIKDLDSGLVDFPSSRDGEEILLCWQLGEDEIAWWHTLDGGFAGRRPL